MVTTLLLLDIGLSVSYPTVLISALTGRNNKNNPNETVRMDPVQASWMGELFLNTGSCWHDISMLSSRQMLRFSVYYFLGSISYLGKMFGSLTCGFASEYFGRRNAMILISIPHLVAFCLFYYSSSVWTIFIANSLLGFGSGYLKGPSTSYITEIRWET